MAALARSLQGRLAWRAGLARTRAGKLAASDGELDQLLFAITAINAWNGLAIASRMQPGPTGCRVPRRRAGD